MAGKDQQRYFVSRTDLTGHDRVLANYAVKALNKTGVDVCLDVRPLPPFAPNTPSTLSELEVSGRRQKDIAKFLDLFALAREETVRRMREEVPIVAPGEPMLPHIVGMRRRMDEREAAVEQLVFERAQAIASGEVKVESLRRRAQRAQEDRGNINVWHLRRCREG